MPWLTPDLPESSEYVYKRIRIPKNLALSGAIDGALLPLTFLYNWEQFGTMTPEQASSIMREHVLEALQGDDWSVIGNILPYATQNAPSHTLPCDGAIYNRVDYPLLYAALHTAFIVDADHFKTPDLIDRFPLGATVAPGGTRPMGAIGGEEAVTLDWDTMPVHTHIDSMGHNHGYVFPLDTVINGGLEAPAAAATASFGGVTDYGYVSLDNAGLGQAHNNMPPFCALRFCIYYE